MICGICATIINQFHLQYKPSSILLREASQVFQRSEAWDVLEDFEASSMQDAALAVTADEI